jgi:hypothetical protein
MSNAGDQLYDVITRICERQKTYREISPIALAAEAMQAIDFPLTLHPLGHIGCEMHFREIARSTLRKRFDPTDPAQEENDLFPETLQERYPIRRDRGEDPRYVLRKHLSDGDHAYNVARLRRSGEAQLKHADALEADGASRMAA